MPPFYLFTLSSHFTLEWGGGAVVIGTSYESESERVPFNILLKKLKYCVFPLLLLLGLTANSLLCFVEHCVMWHVPTSRVLSHATLSGTQPHWSCRSLDSLSCYLLQNFHTCLECSFSYHSLSSHFSGVGLNITS